MKTKRLIPAILVTFLFLVAYEWGFHGVFLKSLYETTPQLWRPQAIMPQYLPYLFAGQFFMAVFLGLVFSKGYENRGIGEGIRFGLLIGLLFAAGHLMWYAVQPVPALLVLSWIIGGTLEMILAGILLAAICRPKAA